MSEHSVASGLIRQDWFLRVVHALDHLAVPTLRSQLCEQLTITPFQLDLALIYLARLGQVIREESAHLFPAQTERTALPFELLVSEWLVLESMMMQMKVGGENLYQQVMAQVHSSPWEESLNRMVDVEQEFYTKDYLKFIERSPSPEILRVVELEKAIAHQLPLRIELVNGDRLNFLPLQVVYPSGEEEYVIGGEDLGTAQLIHLLPREIAQMAPSPTSPQEQHFSPVTVATYLHQVLAATYACWIRLVLKFSSEKQLNLNTYDGEVRKLFVTSSGEGAVLWSGSVRPDDRLFRWVAYLGRDVEILSPLQFKKDYLHFCQKFL